MKGYQKIIIALLLILLFFVGRLLINAGFFTKITPHFNGNITEISGVEGAEDITVDQSTGIAYISSNDFANTNSEKGAIFKYNLNDSAAQLINISGKLPFEFHPHGISFFQNKNGQKSLFVVNHRKNGQFIEIFSISDSALNHRESISNPLIVSPNDVLAVGERTFYFTNDHDEPLSKWRANKDLLQIPMGNVGYFNGKNVEIVADGFLYANGINISPDKKTIYVAEVTNKKIRVFNRNLNDGALTEIDQIAINGGDNIEVDIEGNLWVGCHVNLLAFLAYSKDQTKLSPSEVIKIKYSSVGNYTSESIYQNDGKPLSGSSVGAVYKNKLLIGSVYDDKIILGEMK